MKSCDWVVMGGKKGEAAHCTRCGEGLTLGWPIRIELFAAMAEAFTKLHAKCKPKWVEPTPSSPAMWLLGRDTGMSSKTICAAYTGYSADAYDVPHDGGDFGRCYRFLKLFPDARKELHRTVDRCPAWEPFVKHWDELTALYEEELPSGNAPKLFSRIRELKALTAKETP